MAEAGERTVHPFHEGVRARSDGRDEDDNPYGNEDWRRAAWQHGWETADELIEMQPDPPPQPPIGRARNSSTDMA